MHLLMPTCALTSYGLEVGNSSFEISYAPTQYQVLWHDKISDTRMGSGTDRWTKGIPSKKLLFGIRVFDLHLKRCWHQGS